MKDKDARMLFEYLGSILYDEKVKELSLGSLDGETRELGEGLCFLAECVGELREYAAGISRGNLNIGFPSKENPLCQEWKNLHSNLNHLTWQAKQVAGGDYTQQVSCLGEFSDVFNTMIRQLKERECRLQEKIEEVTRHGAALQDYNEMFINLTRKCKEWIIVTDMDRTRILYCNKNDQGHLEDPSFCQNCKCKIGIQKRIFRSAQKDSTWEFFDDQGKRWYTANLFHIRWERKPALAYIVEDVTVERMEEQRLTEMAYRDMLTGLHNRRYILERAEEYHQEGVAYTFCYVDIDGLKYVNDTFGHKEGDRYINYIVGQIWEELDERDIFARIGGDEFGILSLSKSGEYMQERIEAAYGRVYQRIHQEMPAEHHYRGAFSFGVAQYQGEAPSSFDQVLHQADIEMYKNKMKHKKSRKA